MNHQAKTTIRFILLVSVFLFAAAAYADTTPPTVSILDPDSGDTVSDTVTIRVKAGDDTGIDRVECFIDGEPFDTDRSKPYSFKWDTEDEWNSSHTILVRAYDLDGNSDSDSISVIVNNLPTGETFPPTVSIQSPSDGATVSDKVDVRVDAYDESDIELVEFFIDGISKTEDKRSPYVYDWNTEGYIDGPHTVQVKAYDTVGNSNIDYVNVTVYNNQPDDSKPAVYFITPSDGERVRGATMVAAGASDPSGISRVEFYIDGELEMSDPPIPIPSTGTLKHFRMASMISRLLRSTWKITRPSRPLSSKSTTIWSTSRHRR